jgi:hypothetical protein
MLFVLAALLVMDKHPLAAWAGVFLFGSFALVGAVLLVTGGASLRLDEQGFEMVGILNRSNRLLWRDIASIRMANLRGASVIALDYKTGHPRRSQVSRSLAGMDATVGNIYNVPLKELCAVLTEWHKRYGSGAT